jgi:DNA-binding winged helix-turn-helix (wHTH) protein
MQPVAEREGILRFEGFELDLRSGELSKGGRKIRLQVQPFRILAILLEQRGQVVTRDEFRERLWARNTFVDFDHSLNTAIKKLRQALNDEADKPRLIETLPRRGYRFIGTLSQTGPESSQPSQPREAQPSEIAAELVGKILTVCGVGESHFAVAPVDESTLQEKRRLEVADDSLGLSLLAASGKILLVEEGTRVKVLEARPNHSHFEVRVLGGEHIGQTVLIERKCLGGGSAE